MPESAAAPPTPRQCTYASIRHAKHLDTATTHKRIYKIGQRLDNHPDNWRKSANRKSKFKGYLKKNECKERRKRSVSLKGKLGKKKIIGPKLLSAPN